MMPKVQYAFVEERMSTISYICEIRKKCFLVNFSEKAIDSKVHKSNMLLVHFDK